MEPDPAATITNTLFLENIEAPTKQRLAIALIVTGVALMILGALLIFGAAVFGGCLSVSTVVAISATEVVTSTALTTAGKVVVCAATAFMLGCILTQFGRMIMPRVSERRNPDAMIV